MVGEFASRSLSKEILAVGLVDVMKGLVGSLPVLGVQPLIDVADYFSVALEQVQVLTRFVLP